MGIDKKMPESTLKIIVHSFIPILLLHLLRIFRRRDEEICYLDGNRQKKGSDKRNRLMQRRKIPVEEMQENKIIEEIDRYDIDPKSLHSRLVKGKEGIREGSEIYPLISKIVSRERKEDEEKIEHRPKTKKE